MVGFSKLLIGAFIPSAFGNAVVEAQTAAKPTMKIEVVNCTHHKTIDSGMFFIPQTDCAVTGIEENASGYNDRIYMTTERTGDRYGTAEEECTPYVTPSATLELATGPGQDPIILLDATKEGDTLVTTFGNDSCVLVKFPDGNEAKLDKLLIDIRSGFPPAPEKPKETMPVQLVQQAGKEGEYVPVEESAFFGEDNGEWSLIDFAFIGIIVVLLLCFCLGLYGCWSKKKKMEKDSAANRPAKNNHRRQAIE